MGRAQGSFPSGTFQFTTSSYNVSANENIAPQDASLSPSLLGARLTVTRSGGANGRVLVPFSGASSGTLVFDDYQMSASILVTGAGTVTLGSPVLDPLESADLLPPTLGGTKSETINILAAGSSPTNSVINFERATFRVSRSAPNAIIHVTRTPNGPPPAIPDQGVTVNYTINPILKAYLPQSGFAGNPPPGNSFALEAGSDYAVAGSDFIATNTGTLTGVISFPAGVYDETITIPINNNGLVEFNNDLQVALWIPLGSTEPALVGGVDLATLTILSLDASAPASEQPAGAVDRFWNKDNTDGFDSIPPYLNYPGTQGGISGTANGNGGTVYAAVEQLNGEVVIAGSFNSFDSNPYNHIVRLLNNGYNDPSFLAPPNSGANDVINAMCLQPDGKILIGGSFTAFNGAGCYHIARLNSDGSVDAAFNPGSGVNGQVLSIALQSNGQIIIGGNFTSVNGENMSSVARLNADGSLDKSFNPGTGPDGVVNAVVVDAAGRVIIGGGFDSVSGSEYGGVARLNVDGSLDTSFISGIGTFNPESGFTDPVYALALQGTNLLVGGGFSYMELANYNGLVRLNANGAVDTGFNPGSDSNNGTYNPQTSLADSVYAITVQSDGRILIGGDFTTYNQTRRVGVARLLPDGSLDTSFLDTAYNQFAGLINHYHNSSAVNTNDYPQGNNRNFVCAIAVEAGAPNNVIIGGDFLRVGGGTLQHSGLYDMSANSGIFDNGRMDIHPRSNVARLIGGGTPGPGNISLSYSSYSADKSAGKLYVSLVRTNGSLGVISAVCSPKYETTGPGIATTNDFIGGATATWPTIYSTTAPPGNGSLMSAPGTFGQNFVYDSTYGTGAPGTYPDVFFNIINDTNLTGNLNGGIALSDPSGNGFALGGESIPLGAALGSTSFSPLLIIDSNIRPGVLGFSSPTYTVNQGGVASITVTRANGAENSVQINYIATNGTAVSPTNFTAVAGNMTFGPGVTSQTFTLLTAAATTTNADRTVNLQLSNVTGGATIGLTNAVLTIVNNTFSAGHIAFTAANYYTNETAGTAAITLSRLGGSTGTLGVTAVVGGGTAVSGVNYVASTNVLQWNNNDISARTILVPVVHDGVFTSNLTVNLQLTNGLLNTVANGKVLGLSSVTNATLNIGNVDFPGTVEFTSGAYSVKKAAGHALIPVIRTGGSAQTVTVSFGTQNGTAADGVNYAATNGVLTFTNGEVAKYFAVPVIDDGQPDGLLSLNLKLNNATPGISLGTPSNAVLNIIDTDSVNEPPGSVDPTYSPFAGFNGNIYALAMQPNNQLLVGGGFTMANGVPRQNLARLNADGALDAGFLSPSSATGADGQINTLAIQMDGRIIIGGSFSNFNSVVEGRIARLNFDGSLDSTFNVGSGANNPVYAVAQSPVDGKILVGGTFSAINGVTFNGIGRLNADGTPDVSFNPGGLGIGSLGSSFTVNALAVQADGRIIIGGNFTSFNGVSVNNFARLNTDGTLDTSFNANGIGSSGPVQAIALQLDGRILVGGLFTNVNGVGFNRVARLNTDGSVDMSFQAGMGANNAVFGIAVQSDARIVLGGSFTGYNGVTRNRITRLNPDGSVDSTINFGLGADDYVSAIVIQEGSLSGYPTNISDEKIIFGGAFNQYNGQPQAHLARIFGGSESDSGDFQFSSASYQADENGTNVVIAVQRTGGTSGTNADNSGDIYVPFATSNGSAVAGVNYAAVSTNLDFPAGEVVEYVTIPVFDDRVVTTNLTLNLGLGSPFTEGNIGNQPTASVTIINDDSTIGFSSATYSVAKNINGGTAGISIARNGATYGTSTVQFSTTTSGTAVSGTDFTPVSQQLIFNPGVSNITVNIPVNNNNISEGNRTVGMQLADIVGSFPVSQTNATLTIVDTVNAPGGFVFSSTNYNVIEGPVGGYSTAVITVMRTNGSTGNVSVNFATVDGTAVNGVNYFATNGVLVFSGGQISQAFTVQILNATAVAAKQFTVVLSNPTGGSRFAGTTIASVTILNSNTEIAFFSATNSFTEPANISTSGSVSLKVVRFNNTNGLTTVNYSTTNGTAVAGINFVGITNGVLTFPPGVLTTNIVVQTLYDQNHSGDLQFTLGLAVTNSGAQLVFPSATTVVDHDSNPGLSFLTASNRVFSNTRSVPIYVICSNTNGFPISVGYSTVNGTAMAGVDFTGISGILTFAGNQLTNLLNVPIFSGAQVQSNKTFSVTLSAPTGSGVLVYPSNELVTILWTNTALSSPVIWLGNAGDTVWDDSTFNWELNQGASLYADGENVLFNDLAYSGSVVISGSVAPGNVTFANSTNINYALGSYSLNPGEIFGPTELVKTNGGTLSLLSGNLYAGGTLIYGGTLLINSTNGSGTGTGAVTVDGGTLGGAGIISGAVTVNAGGEFAPGNPLGMLAISNSLTLAAGGTAYFQIEHQPLTNSATKISSTLTEGGTLIVTNIGGVSFVKGDSFTLFNAGNYVGAFSNLVLPPLSSGLVWNSNGLSASGVLTVVEQSPVIRSVTMSQGALILQGGAGVPRSNFYLLSATNPATPMTNWTCVLTNKFDSRGNFNFTNLLNTTNTKCFFRLLEP